MLFSGDFIFEDSIGRVDLPHSSPAEMKKSILKFLKFTKDMVSIDALPEVFPKVIEVKRLLACGEEKSSAGACKRVGISRSAYYKYRECVFTYDEKLTQKIVTYYAVLRDEPGILSLFLSEIHKNGANILTVNQNIPIDGVASVTITARLNGNTTNSYTLREHLSSLNGVVEVKFIAGE